MTEDGAIHRIELDRLLADPIEIWEYPPFGGCTFDGGLYRIHGSESARLASGWVNEAFPEFQGKLVCFGFDWLGRQFALDPLRGSAPDLQVLMLEPGTAEALEVPVSFSRFHDDGLEDYYDACLAPEFFAEWMAARAAALALHRMRRLQGSALPRGRRQHLEPRSF